MKKTSLLVGLIMAATQVFALQPDSVMEGKIEALLNKMSLAEKIGQMCEITVDVVTDFSTPDGSFKFSQTMLDTVIGKYKVGSILNVPRSVAQSKETWRALIKQLQDQSLKDIGIPCIYGLDQIHGTTYSLGGTLYPQEINLGATFNADLVQQLTSINAYETRCLGVPWIYAPVMDLGRHPAWPRVYESFGEDSYVNTKLAVAATLGCQGADANHIDARHVGTSLKHYMCYGVPTSGRDRTPSSVTYRAMKEKFFEPFKACLQAGALSIMVNSSTNDGVPFHANYKLLTQWVKEDLQWDGLIVTDWADINNIYSRDHVTATKKDAIVRAINAGIDMSMVPYEVSFCDLLKEAVDEGQVSMERINDAVRRVLRLKYRLGLFDNPYGYPQTKVSKKHPAFDKDYGCTASATLARSAAEESMVLLKNEKNLLPLKPGTKVFVTGPNANTMRGLNGGWSYSWQGHLANVCTAGKGYKTIVDALKAQFDVTYAPSVEYVETEGASWEDETVQPVTVPDDAEVIIVCVGENSYAETPGNIFDLNLSLNQKMLVMELAKSGKPIVLVLNEGRARLVREIEPLCGAIVDIMLPGNYGGEALTNLLCGAANFSGKLPITYPKYPNFYVPYDYKPCENIGQMAGNYNYDAVMDNQWDFGFGLSYTTYSYANLRCNKTLFNADDTLQVYVDVTNTGSVDGKEAVLLYFSDLVASLTPDNKRLCAFEKVSLKSGETKTVAFIVPAKRLAFVDTDERWILEQGAFLFRCADQTLSLTCEQTSKWY